MLLGHLRIMTMNKCYCECLPLCLFDFRPTHRIKCPLSFYSMGWWCQKSAHQCERFDCFFSRFIRKISRLLSNSRNRRCADLRRASVTNVMFVIYWFKLMLCSNAGEHLFWVAYEMRDFWQNCAIFACVSWMLI